MTIFTDKVNKYNTRLMTDLGITDIQACGIWGNIGAETGGFKHLQELKPVVAGSRGGYGWMQWTGPRRRKYEAWCQSRSLNPANDESNYQYLVYETKTDEQKSLSQLKKTTSIEAAVETFMAHNLRPGVKHLDSRINWGKQAYNGLVSKSKANTQVVVAGGAAAGGAVVMTQVPFSVWTWMGEHWFITGAVAAAVIYGIIWGIHRYKEANKQDVLPVETVKKGKKNDKSRT